MGSICQTMTLIKVYGREKEAELCGRLPDAGKLKNS